MTVLGYNVIQNKCTCGLTTDGPKIGHFGILKLPNAGTIVMPDALL